MKNFAFSPPPPLPLRALGYLVLLLFLSYLGCQKDALVSSSANDPQRAPGGLVSSCGEPLWGTNVLELVTNTDDPADNRINMVLYHYAVAIKNAVQDPSLLCYMVNAVSEDANRVGISIYTLAQGNPSFAAAINNSLRENVNAVDVYPRGSSPEAGIDALRNDPSWDANSYLRTKIVYEGISYAPVIYSFTQPSTGCIPQNAPTVLIGTAADDCDDVAGWTGNTEVLFSETQVAGSNDIIIFVGNGELYSYSPSPLAGTNEGDQLSFRADSDIDVDLFQIKKRFDTTKRSEVKGWRVRWQAGTANPNSTGWTDFNPKKVHKNDIPNKVFTDDQDAFSYQNDSATPNSIFFGAYEYDWWPTDKKIVNNCASEEPTLQIERSMKYATDVYFKHCGVGNTIFPSVGSTYNVNNDNCRFLMKRGL